METLYRDPYNSYFLPVETELFREALETSHRLIAPTEENDGGKIYWLNDSMNGILGKPAIFMQFVGATSGFFVRVSRLQRDFTQFYVEFGTFEKANEILAFDFDGYAEQFTPLAAFRTKMDSTEENYEARLLEALEIVGDVWQLDFTEIYKEVAGAAKDKTVFFGAGQ